LLRLTQAEACGLYSGASFTEVSAGLVVVDDLDVMGVAVAPDKADSESVVNPDAVLTPPVAAQRVQPVSGKDCQIPEIMGRVQLAQSPLSDAGDCLKAAGRSPVEQPLGFFRPERPDHELEGHNAPRCMSSGIAAIRVRRGPFAFPLGQG
jgi:hypothetical protein